MQKVCFDAGCSDCFVNTTIFTFTGKGTFNCDRFLGLMALYHERAKNQDAELRAAFKVFDKEAKGYIDWNTLK